MNAEQVRKAKNESNGHSLAASKESEARFGFLFCGHYFLIAEVCEFFFSSWYLHSCANFS
ncbi:hypothetical protein T439DRAFT_202255 [Meredithblackwellia eburnea MCA 4105]